MGEDGLFNIRIRIHSIYPNTSIALLGKEYKAHIIECRKSEIQKGKKTTSQWNTSQNHYHESCEAVVYSTDYKKLLNIFFVRMYLSSRHMGRMGMDVSIMTSHGR